MAKNWIDEEIDFYDFIWSEGTRLCANHVNDELRQDFAKGGNKFEEMKAEILKRFPTREEAQRALINSMEAENKQDGGFCDECGQKDGHDPICSLLKQP